jgi:hypothetical protein
MSSQTLADVVATASKHQLEQIRLATGLDRHQLEHRKPYDTALWVRRAIAEALHRPVDEVFGPAGRQP